MLSITDGDAVREITLDRPDARNALTRQGVTALADAVTAASQPVVYLHGAGTAFCAGADLDVVADLDGDTGAAFARRGQRTMNAIVDADAVVVAGVDGPARGGGVELALACDVRVCTPAASFAETGVTLGLFGAWGGTRRLRQAVGTTHAADLSLSGRTVDATDARAMGLVSRIVEDPRAVADEIAANDPDALRALQALLGQNGSQAATDEREAAAFGRLHAEPR
ncbi:MULTISPECIES: enoyl-CoA hydratase/isomerase family protein [Halobacterium]|uniref:enoyl-CoA hydratase/isomerase family protein n=1 Tax=Halobacterium TaxID=2239 RepID=UPI001964CFE3|nr:MULTISPECIES: enoyl-CoA hydratase/isomerase family protein [Halobacterium]MCF2239614.1 enoyl-CoA hydratase/isomerase family protein [Halobacterium salinarum]QRY22255.1 enoyl-CoA hydratase/isomerase family protein [Halobacterium sp. GSL-19]WJK63627.1 enoyl-CoA hydratase/isomerase family protein [Halobacterium salinarum]